jgi:hypothetical protein
LGDGKSIAIASSAGDHHQAKTGRPEEEAVCRHAKWKAVAFIVAVVTCQAVRPERTNPTTDSSRTIQAQRGTPSGLGTVLDRACGDCHSNSTVWPWYTKIAPLSWAMAHGVSEGRKAVNFSEWASYPPEAQRQLLDQSCRDASEGKMPARAWTLLHPEARLSAQDIELICAAARRTDDGGSR